MARSQYDDKGSFVVAITSVQHPSGPEYSGKVGTRSLTLAFIHTQPPWPVFAMRVYGPGHCDLPVLLALLCPLCSLQVRGHNIYGGYLVTPLSDTSFDITFLTLADLKGGVTLCVVPLVTMTLITSLVCAAPLTVCRSIDRSIVQVPSRPP